MYAHRSCPAKSCACQNRYDETVGKFVLTRESKKEMIFSSQYGKIQSNTTLHINLWKNIEPQIFLSVIKYINT